MKVNPSTESAAENPIIRPWTGNYGGVPAFDKIKIKDFEPAFESLRSDRLVTIIRIAENSDKPTLENTIEALERLNRALQEFAAVYSVWSSNLSTPDFQQVERNIAPKMAAMEDEMIQNEALFKRIESIYNSPDKLKMTPEQQRLVWLYYTNFTRAGAKLSRESKEKLKQINLELANQFTRFQQNVLGDETDEYLIIERAEDLKGLPDFLVTAAGTEAGEKNLLGKWVINNTRSTIDPFLTYSENRQLREKAWRMFTNRGDNKNAYNNNAIIASILALRQQRAKLLGFETHAHWRLENTMAKNPANALHLLDAVWKPAVQRVKAEVAEMQAMADQENAQIKIEPWDYHFYMEKVRRQRYEFDSNELKPYLQLHNLRESMFYVAESLFGLTFIPIADVPVFHPDVQVWKVEDIVSKATIGLFYFDPFARKGKRSGAWMNALREQENLDKRVATIVSNNSNFTKGKPGEPILISWDDATTLFHEFGHALHGLCSNVKYSSLSGTNVFRDYVEFPSQLLEHWLATPEVTTKYLVHYKTDEPIPAALLHKLERTATFKQGYATVEFMGSAWLDMKIHLSNEESIDIAEFENATLKEIGMPTEIAMRHRPPHFLHIFSDDGYSAGYYSYLWADVITADAWEAFAANPFDKTLAEKLKQHVFSVGNTIDPEAGYRMFRGRDPKVQALMAKRGFSL